MTSTIHHVFPYDPRHLGLSAERWIDTQVQRWPLAAVGRTNSVGRTIVHFIGPQGFQIQKHDLIFICHRALISGPRWWTWGDDWSPSLDRTLRKLNPRDLCVLHLDSYFAAEQVHYVARHSRVVVVLHGRGFAGQHIRVADGVFALRQQVGNTLVAEGYPRDRIIVEPPTINQAIFKPRVAIPPFPLRLGFVAVLNSYVKGLDQLAETVQLLRAQQIPFVFELAGTGTAAEKEAFHRQLQADKYSDVVFLDQLGAAQIAERMATWHLLLHPSRSEGMPIAILEALSIGLPVVAVGGVFPVELEGQAGVHTTSREEYARFVAANYETLAQAECSRNLVWDHSAGAATWERLETIHRRGGVPTPPPNVERYWRLRILRTLIQDRPLLRRAIRWIRRALGPVGGLPAEN